MQNNIWFLMMAGLMTSQAGAFSYAVSDSHPFGQANPAAPKEILDFAPLIGHSNCWSTTRIDQNNWAEKVKMDWTFRYILNGMAVQDESMKSDGNHGGSLRQYNDKAGTWMVHYYNSSSSPEQLPAWQGGQEDNDLVFRKPHQAPDGTEGKFRLTFFDITDKGFKWVGEWVDMTETIVYPTWKISCTKST